MRKCRAPFGQDGILQLTTQYLGLTLPNPQLPSPNPQKERYATW